MTTSVHVRGLLLSLLSSRRTRSTGERQVEILEIGCIFAQQFFWMIVEKLVISASFSAGLESNEQGSQRLGIGNTCVYTVFRCKQLEDAFFFGYKTYSFTSLDCASRDYPIKTINTEFYGALHVPLEIHMSTWQFIVPNEAGSDQVICWMICVREIPFLESFLKGNCYNEGTKTTEICGWKVNK